MVEPIMYFGIGFLVAALIGLIVIPLVHGRAVRLTMRRLEAATPLSMAEIQADKDQLRAEFAMSMRRLEMNAEQLKNKTASQLAEISKKSDAINLLKIELGEKTAAIFALEARDKALRDQLHATEGKLAAETSSVQEAGRSLSGKDTDIARLVADLDKRSSLTEAQKVEIAALKVQIEGLKERLVVAGNETKTIEGHRDAERARFKVATKELGEERSKVENLGRRISELEQQLVAQTTEAAGLRQRAHELETRLGEQSRLLARNETELVHRRTELGAAHKTEADLRAAINDISERTGAVAETLNSEKAQLQAELERANGKHALLTHELADMKRDSEKAAVTERAENTLMRERINDIAAEIARLASVLEGPNSPIDAILAAGAARARTSGPAGSDAEFPKARETSGSLADRIRALQSRASRTPHQCGSTSRN